MLELNWNVSSELTVIERGPRSSGGSAPALTGDSPTPTLALGIGALCCPLLKGKESVSEQEKSKVGLALLWLPERRMFPSSQGTSSSRWQCEHTHAPCVWGRVSRERRAGEEREVRRSKTEYLMGLHILREELYFPGRVWRDDRQAVPHTGQQGGRAARLEALRCRRRAS